MEENIKKRLDYILERLIPHGPISARAMFGGYGLYWEKTIFATLVYGKLYFRVDASNSKDFEAYKSEPLVFEGKNRPVVMPYMMLPEKILNDPKQLPIWISKAKATSLKK